MSGRKGLMTREPSMKPRATMAWRDWVKGGDLSGPSMYSTRELLAVSKLPRNTPATRMAVNKQN